MRVSEKKLAEAVRHSLERDLKDARARASALEAERDAAKADAEGWKVKWKREECARCDEYPGGFEGTVYCEGCLAYYRRDVTEEHIQRQQRRIEALEAERDGLAALVGRLPEMLKEVANKAQALYTEASWHSNNQDWAWVTLQQIKGIAEETNSIDPADALAEYRARVLEEVAKKAESMAHFDGNAALDAAEIRAMKGTK